MSITIRRATEADAEALRSIYAPYVADTTITFEYEVPSVSEFAGRIRAFGAEYPYLVCESDGEAIGYAYADRVRERAAYDWDVEPSVYLRQGTHGRGIGTVLLACLVELLEMQGIRHLYSCVTMPNEKSVRMQKKLGFEDAGRWQDSGWKFGAWHDVAWFQKHIGAGEPRPVTPFPELDDKEIQKTIDTYSKKLNLEEK